MTASSNPRSVFASPSSARAGQALRLNRLRSCPGSAIEPVDRPIYSTVAVDVAGAVRRALSTRTDLDVARREVWPLIWKGR